MTVVAAGPVIDMTAGGGAGLVTMTAAEGTRAGDTLEAEAETEIEVEIEREAGRGRENDVAATVIDHATDVVVGEAMTMNRLTGTTTVKIPDTAAEVQTDSVTHMAWSITMITDNLLDCSAIWHCMLVWYMLTVPYDTFISPVNVAEHIVKLSLGKILIDEIMIMLTWTQNTRRIGKLEIFIHWKQYKRGISGYFYHYYQLLYNLELTYCNCQII